MGNSTTTGILSWAIAAIPLDTRTTFDSLIDRREDKGTAAKTQG